VSEVTDEPAAGHVVAGRYTIEQGLSSGAMGAVYRARNEDGRPVALKRLLDPSQAARFEIEARLLMRLSHPRIGTVIEHITDNDSQFLVMGLVEGRDLNAVLRERGAPGLPVVEALDYTREAAEALDYVHGQGVVHRDVKPHNLICGPAGVVLVDFGIAREQVSAWEGGTRAIGTPLYMAPEVLVGEELSPRSDVYSLAATTWALIRGEPPAYDDPTPLSEEVEGISPEIERALRAALQIRSERRVASVAALAAGLGVPLEGGAGRSLALSVQLSAVPSDLLEAIVRTTAGVLEGAAASIALVDRITGELVYEASWGAGAEEIVGVRLPAGTGLAGSVVATGAGIAIPDCRSDPRFAESVARKTGYVPHTMLVAPLWRHEEVMGVLSVLDRRDGEPYRPGDLEKARLFSELAVSAISEAERRGS
jgi:predicted Ser/Thr protein kinase